MTSVPVPLPRAATAEGQAGLDAILADPARALIATDFDGTLAPIVADPADAAAAPGAAAALTRLAKSAGTVAIVTGRPAAAAVALSGVGEVPGLIVLGHYGGERWEAGELTSAAAPDGVARVRQALPGVLAAAGAPQGTRIEDKGTALAVHTRQTASPEAALDPAARAARRARGGRRAGAGTGPFRAGTAPARRRQGRRAAGARRRAGGARRAVLR